MASQHTAVSIKKYEAFAAVTRLQSLTKAAQLLGCTQSAVSHTIFSLEQELGFPLLLRSRAGVQLTPQGQRILPEVLQLLEHWHKLEQTVTQVRGLCEGTVRVGAFTSVAVHWLPGWIKDFCALYPGVDFQLLSGDYHDIDLWLQQGSIDLGFVALPAGGEYTCTPLYEDRLLVILPPDHPLAQLDTVPAARLCGEDFISLLESSDHDTRRALESAGIHPKIKYTTKDDYAIIAMVESGLGVSIMPELLLQGHTENVCVRPLDPPAARTIALAVPSRVPASPAAARFAQFISQHSHSQPQI